MNASQLSPRDQEISRIHAAYAKRRQVDFRYSYFNAAYLQQQQERERALLAGLERNLRKPLSECQILDLGCGSGSTLLDFLRYGAKPQNLFGIDLLETRIDSAKARLPQPCHLQTADARQTPFEEETFDIIYLSTVLSSVLDNQDRKSIANEILRITKKDGLIIHYDFAWNNPKNPDVRAVERKEVHQLFKIKPVFERRLSLAPPLARWAATRCPRLLSILNLLPFLKTHWMMIFKPSSRL